MSRPLEYDCIGLSDVPLMENSDKMLSFKASTLSTAHVKGGGLKTDLSLGLPGSESAERKSGSVVTLFGKELEGETQNGVSIGPLMTCASGAKRGFSDAIHGSEKWVLSVNARSETKSSKDGVLYSPTKLAVPSSTKPVVLQKPENSAASEHGRVPATKAQVVGWPPIRSFRKNSMTSNTTKNNNDQEEKSVSACLYVKVSMDGAPYLRKVDLQTYRNYKALSSALEKMFSCFIKGQYGSHGHASRDGLGETHSKNHPHSAEYALTYEDKDGDWMLVGDVPWKMFMENCKKLRIMKGSETTGLAPSATEKCHIKT